MENMETTRAEEDMDQEVSLRCEAGRWVGDRRTCRGELFRILFPRMEELLLSFFPAPRPNFKCYLSNKSQLILFHTNNHFNIASRESVGLTRASLVITSLLLHTTRTYQIMGSKPIKIKPLSEAYSQFIFIQHSCFCLKGIG